MKHIHRLAGWAFFGCVASATGCNRGTSPTSEDTNADLAPLGRSPQAEVNTRATVLGGQVEIARASNVRYIGALPTRGGRHLRSRVLLRSGHLALVNDEGYAEMLKLGIASVVDFRSSTEARAAPDAPWVVRGMRHTSIELPEIVPSSADSYLQMLRAIEPTLPRLFAHLGTKSALPALLHCGTGRGRACAGMAIVLLSLGVSPLDVASDFANNQEVGADPTWLDGVFAKVAAAGGIDAYLQMHAVAQADVESLRLQALN